MKKSRKMISGKKANNLFRKASYVKKDNRHVQLHRGGYRLP